MDGGSHATGQEGIAAIFLHWQKMNPPSFSAERVLLLGLKPVPQDVFDILGEQTVRHLPPAFLNWLPEIMFCAVFEHLVHTFPYRKLQS